MHGRAQHLFAVAVSALGTSRSLVFAEVELHQLFGGHGGEGVGFAGGIVAEFNFKYSVLPSVNNRPDLAATQAVFWHVFSRGHHIKNFYFVHRFTTSSRSN